MSDMVLAMQKTKEECWAEFWEIFTPALVELHQQGLLTEAPDTTAEAA